MLVLAVPQDEEPDKGWETHGPTIFPKATPKKIDADASTLFVTPPTLPDTKDKARTKTALEEPVK